MILGTKNNDAQLMALVPSIKHNMNEWQIVNIVQTKACHLSQDEVVEKLMHAYKDYEGIVYALRDRKVICLVRMGIINNYAKRSPSNPAVSLPEK